MQFKKYSIILFNLLKNLLKIFCIFLIKIYQYFISPFFGCKYKCRFTPTCSEYTKEAIRKYGIIKGCWKGFKRILRCNPFNKNFGYDPLDKN